MYSEERHQGLQWRGMIRETTCGDVQTKQGQESLPIIQVFLGSGSSWHGVETWPEGTGGGGEGTQHLKIETESWCGGLGCRL